MYKRFTILPVMLLLCAAFFSSAAFAPVNQYANEGTELARLEAEAIRLSQLPAGSPISVVLTDDSLTQAAQDALNQYSDQIHSLIKQYTNIDAKISSPKVEFNADGFRISVKTGVSFIKVTAAANGVVNLVNGKPEVIINKVSLPVIKVSPEEATSQIKGLIDAFGSEILNFATFSKIEITDGQMSVEGIKN